jgi:glycosyltransferase involved in cell wall biosynthesis
MTRVVLVAGDLNTWGGMDRANYELAWHLAEEVGVELHLVSYHVAQPLSQHPNVIWHKIPKLLNSYLLAGPLLNWMGRSVARDLRSARVIVNGGNCDWPDINWVHAVHAAWNNRTQHAPLSVQLRATVYKRRAIIDERRAIRSARIVVANSRTARQQIIERVGIPPERVHAVYCGTDPHMFHPASAAEKLAARQRFSWAASTPIAVFIGSLGHDRNKGFDVLFDAWKELCHDLSWDVNLVALGTGSEVELWRQAAAYRALDRRVQIMGFTKNVSEILRAADVMIHPTHYEGYGIGVHEALCCGLPAFVTCCAGVAERYPEELSGLLLGDPPSARDLIERLRGWRADIEGYRARVAAFAATLRQRTWSDMAREFVELTMPPPEKSSSVCAACPA